MISILVPTTAKNTIGRREGGENEKEIARKKEKKAEDYNKHLVSTFQRYQSEERRHRDNEKEESYKLRKQLQEFYDKEEERKKQQNLSKLAWGLSIRRQWRELTEFSSKIKSILSRQRWNSAKSFEGTITPTRF